LPDYFDLGQASGSLSQENSFPLVRFHQGDFAVWLQNGDWNTGETSPAANVRHGANFILEVRSEKQRFAIMPNYGFCARLD
jgi:hypothetical protein